MSEQTDGHSKTMLSRLFDSKIFKIACIAILVILMLKPAMMLDEIIKERLARINELIENVASKWGGGQKIIGPVLTVPYSRSDGVICYAHFMPESLDVTGDIASEEKGAGLFSAKVYNARLDLSGKFTFPDTSELEIPSEYFQWDNARVSVHISNIQGIRDRIVFNLNKEEFQAKPEVINNDLFSSGFSVKFALNPSVHDYSYNIPVNLTGSKKIGFVPCGKTTTVALNSNWPEASFYGSFQPFEKNIESNDLMAKWKVLDFNRSFPQQWLGRKYKKEFQCSNFGVNLPTPTGIYEKSRQAIGYGLLFIILTYTSLFIFEMTSSIRLHPIQYLLIGLGIITFHALLISLSEQISFQAAYWISSIAVILMISLYAKSILRSAKLAALLGGLLAIVYTFSFWTLQVAEYALLAGSLGFFILLSFMMYLTRNVDWYSIKQSPTDEMDDIHL